ncbi:MAG: malic enzyme-like NAD(P)-binding protein, partial [Polyangiales bacterium]
DRPIVFPLSNPSSLCEALPEDVFKWTEGRAIVATGSPFDPVEFGGKSHPIGQGNNAFIFPGLGFGAILAEAREITDGMVLEASYALADYVADKHLATGRIYPPVAEMVEASNKVAARVMARAIEDGVSEHPKKSLPELEEEVRTHRWAPRYLPIKRA